MSSNWLELLKDDKPQATEYDGIHLTLIYSYPKEMEKTETHDILLTHGVIGTINTETNEVHAITICNFQQTFFDYVGQCMAYYGLMRTGSSRLRSFFSAFAVFLSLRERWHRETRRFYSF